MYTFFGLYVCIKFFFVVLKLFLVKYGLENFYEFLVRKRFFVEIEKFRLR